MLLSSADFFLITFSIILSGTLSLEPDQDRHSVNPDLGLNCLQGFSADNKSRSQLRNK